LTIVVKYVREMSLPINR